MELALVLFASISLVIGTAYLARTVFQFSLVEAGVFVLIIQELFKKILYIAAIDIYGKGLGLVLGAAPIMALFMVRGMTARPRHYLQSQYFARDPATFAIVVYILALVTSNAIAGGSWLGLSFLSNLIFWPLGWIWAAGTESDKATAAKWIFRFLIIASLVGAYNSFIETDWLWAAYGEAAYEFAIGARYLPDTGYSGSLFSSPSEYGHFTLAATALIMMLRTDKSLGLGVGLVSVSLLASVTSGGRFVIAAVAIFWLVYFTLQFMRFNKLATVIGLLAIPFIVDIGFRSFLDAMLTYAPDTTSRIANWGTIGSRVGGGETLGVSLVTAVREFPLLGVGFGSYWELDFLSTLDDRHNFILGLIEQSGAIGALCYLIFIFRHVLITASPAYRDMHWARPSLAYLAAAFFMGQGGPAPTNQWFFLAAGIIGGLGASVAMRKKAIEQYQMHQAMA